MMPRITFIIPVRNEAHYITRCIESVFSMQGIEQAEVLVVDGMSNDGTRERLAALAKRFTAMKILDNPAKRVTSALNIGIQNATGSVIVRLDAHALYAPDYITACLRVMEQTGAANVGGHMRALPSGPGIVTHAIAITHYSSFGLGGGSFHDLTREGEAETVWLGCYKREVFEKVGLFTEALFRSEDIDMNHRLKRTGYRIYLSLQIKAWYFCRPTLRALFRQRFLDGRGVVQTLGVNHGAVRPRHLVPLAAALLGMTLLFGISLGSALNMPRFLTASAAGLAAAIGMWIVAALYFSFAAYRRVEEINAQAPDPKYTIRKSAAALLPLVFATLHLSYGLGSLVGIAEYLLSSRRC